MDNKTSLPFRRRNTPSLKGIIVALCAFMNTHMAIAGIIEPTETYYVKLNFEGNTGGGCGGSLIGGNLVLSASHCFADNWSAVRVQYGNQFQNEMQIIRNKSTPNFIKFDHNGVSVDLALLKLNAPVSSASGAIITELVAQDYCEFKNIYWFADLRMKGFLQELPRPQMEVKNITINSIGPSALADGIALIADSILVNRGDSGGPLVRIKLLPGSIPLRYKAVQAGVISGASIEDKTYFAALCKYSDDIKRFAKQLGAQIGTSGKTAGRSKSHPAGPAAKKSKN